MATAVKTRSPILWSGAGVMIIEPGEGEAPELVFRRACRDFENKKIEQDGEGFTSYRQREAKRHAKTSNSQCSFNCGRSGMDGAKRLIRARSLSFRAAFRVGEEQAYGDKR